MGPEQTNKNKSALGYLFSVSTMNRHDVLFSAAAGAHIIVKLLECDKYAKHLD
jgi:hypothetical protein